MQPTKLLHLTLFTMFLLTVQIEAFSQKCKYEKNEVDAVTEFAIKRTASTMVLRVNNEPLYFKSQCIGPNKYLKLSYYNYGNFTFDEDREISFITPSNEEIILYPRIVPTDTTKDDEYMDVTSLIVYKLSPTQYETLKNMPTQKFKYFISTGFVEKEIVKNKQGTIMHLLQCVE